MQEEAVKLLIALLVGAIIGTEREYRNKTAGFRTITLICFASCLFTILSAKIGINSPDRIAANIVTGIGFLGAGAIFRTENRIGGLTTAATIWVSAAMGMCIGGGFLLLALEGLVVIMLVLTLFTYIENKIDQTADERHYKITCQNIQEVEPMCEQLFVKHKLKTTEHKLHRKADSYVLMWTAIGKKQNHTAFCADVLLNGHVAELEY